MIQIVVINGIIRDSNSSDKKYYSIKVLFMFQIVVINGIIRDSNSSYKGYYL